MDKVNLGEKLAGFDEHWAPRIVADYNGNDVMVVKVEGEFVWHSHEETDDFFLVLEGRARHRAARPDRDARAGRALRGAAGRRAPAGGARRGAPAPDRAAGHAEHRRPGDRGEKTRMMRPGPRNLITDVPGLLVGNAADARLKSGVTVLTADAPFVAGVDVRGGAPGTRETDLLAPGRTVRGGRRAGARRRLGVRARRGLGGDGRAAGGGPRLRGRRHAGAAGAGGDPLRPRERRRQGLEGEPLPAARGRGAGGGGAGLRASARRGRGPAR